MHKGNYFLQWHLVDLGANGAGVLSAAVGSLREGNWDGATQTSCRFQGSGPTHVGPDLLKSMGPDFQVLSTPDWGQGDAKRHTVLCWKCGPVSPSPILATADLYQNHLDALSNIKELFILWGRKAVSVEGLGVKGQARMTCFSLEK